MYFSKRRSGFTFTELHIRRIPNDPKDDGNNTLVSFYALYPNGTLNIDGVPVPLTILINAWTTQLATIQQDVSLRLFITTERVADSQTQSDDPDWPLILGISIAGGLLLILGVCVLIM